MLSEFTNHNNQQLTSHTLEAITFLVPGSTDKVISAAINVSFNHATFLTREYIFSAQGVVVFSQTVNAVKEKPLTRSILQNHLGDFLFNNNNIELNAYKTSTKINVEEVASLITQKAFGVNSVIVTTIENDLRRHVTGKGELNISVDISASQTAYRNLNTLFETKETVDVTITRERLFGARFEYSVNISGELIRIIGYWWHTIIAKFN